MTNLKNKLFDDRFSQPVRDNIYNSIRYLECRFWGSHFIDCSWCDCRFKRVKFASGVVFENCEFKNTRFETAHTWLTGCFKNCKFEDCVFAAASVGDATFENCSFSGTLESMIFYGKKAPKNLQVILKHVNFSQAKFLNTDFRMKVDLKTVVFPANDDGLYIEGKQSRN